VTVSTVRCVLVAVTMYVRYRQVAEYVSMPDSPHSDRLNKAALVIGLGAAFGMSLIANFPVRESPSTANHFSCFS